MKAKEKAQELLLKFKEVPMGYGFNEVSWSIPSSVAKLLALRCVDEILYAYPHTYDLETVNTRSGEEVKAITNIRANIEYWLEVKKEIELL